MKLMSSFTGTISELRAELADTTLTISCRYNDWEYLHTQDVKNNPVILRYFDGQEIVSYLMGVFGEEPRTSSKLTSQIVDPDTIYITVLFDVASKEMSLQFTLSRRILDPIQEIQGLRSKVSKQETEYSSLYKKYEGLKADLLELKCFIMHTSYFKKPIDLSLYISYSFYPQMVECVYNLVRTQTPTQYVNILSILPFELYHTIFTSGIYTYYMNVLQKKVWTNGDLYRACRVLLTKCVKSKYYTKYRESQYPNILMENGETYQETVKKCMNILIRILEDNGHYLDNRTALIQELKENHIVSLFMYGNQQKWFERFVKS